MIFLLQKMKYEHMFMALLFVISVTALVVGSIALSKDDRDEIIVDDDSELNSTLSLASRGPGHRSKITTVFLTARDNVVVISRPKNPTQYFLTIPPHTNYIFELDRALHVHKPYTYVVTGYYFRSNRPTTIYPSIQNNTSNEITVQIMYSNNRSRFLRQFLKRDIFTIPVDGVFSFHSRAPEVVNLSGRALVPGIAKDPFITNYGQLYTSATLAFNE